MLKVPLNVRVWFYRGAAVVLFVLIAVMLLRALADMSPPEEPPLRYYADSTCTHEATMFATERKQYRPGDSIELTAYLAIDYQLTYYVFETLLNIDTHEQYPLEGLPITVPARVCEHVPPRDVRQDVSPGRYVLKTVVAFKGKSGREWVLDSLQTTPFEIAP